MKLKEVLRKIILFFSIYVSPLEKEIDVFFESIEHIDDKNGIESKLLAFLKRDIVVFNVWLEKKYKGYKYLTNNQRYEMYQNARRLKYLFLDFYNSNKTVESMTISMKLDLINKFFKQKIKYVYRESSDFGRLLKNPRTEELVGDCNQIVTLYIYLFSFVGDISELKLKIFDNHVCLNIGDFDVECTSFMFTKHDNTNFKILSVSEIVSINLLDVFDQSKNRAEILPQRMFEQAKISYLLSNNISDIVGANFKKAHQNLILDYIKRENFDNALILANSLNDYEIQKHVIRSQGIYYYRKQNYSKACLLFQKIEDNEGVQRCYEAIYNEELKKIKGIKYAKDLIKKKDIINKLDEIASKSKSDKLKRHIRALKSSI